MEIDIDLSSNFIQLANYTDAKKLSKIENKTLCNEKVNSFIYF